jgi:hypothetical protein
MRARLNPGGGIALNVERVPGNNQLVDAIAGTVATEFPQAWVWPALHFNELVVGLDDAIPTKTSLADRLTALPVSVQALGSLVLEQSYTVPPSKDPLTDDRAPVEWLTDEAILAYIAGGGTLDEHLLPTAPVSAGKCHIRHAKCRDHIIRSVELLQSGHWKTQCLHRPDVFGSLTTFGGFAPIRGEYGLEG